MSMNSLANTTDFVAETRHGLVSILFGKVRLLVSALAQGKAAADHYQALVARGVPPGEASQAVFRRHFGQR